MEEEFFLFATKLKFRRDLFSRNPEDKVAEEEAVAAAAVEAAKNPAVVATTLLRDPVGKWLPADDEKGLEAPNSSRECYIFNKPMIFVS